MKRINRRIDYRETGIFKVNSLTEKYIYDWFEPGVDFWVSIIFLSSYQICNVYTKKNTVIEAYKKLNGQEATYQVVLDADRKRNLISRRQDILKHIYYNDHYNCHGFTFLDGLFWFELNNEKLARILSENNYVPCSREHLKEGGACLFYNSSGQIIHSGRLHNGVIKSKFGITDILTQGEEEVYNRYASLDIDRTKTLFYNVSPEDQIIMQPDTLQRQ